ncbi:hypothetical protein SBV1_390004 [Verrucomicrobia bacterium]|nr:hypothetical protein SBV1_390004 [Verrucomicrobiota bacterium]
MFGSNMSTLKTVIGRGLANGRLRQELRELRDVKFQSLGDAEAICWGLKQLGDNSEPELLAEHTYALAVLFQSTGGRESPAFKLLQEQGIPELLRLFDTVNMAPTKDGTRAQLFILKILGLYGTVKGTLKIVEAARQPLIPGDYMWSAILRGFTAWHPQKDLLYNSLREPLPAGFIAVSLLDAANAVLIEGSSMSHPFDTPEGKERLRGWLMSPDSEEFSYALSATAALPFVGNPERDSLLALALSHPDTDVRIEAAWAAAKLGRDDGLQRLIECCRDLKTAQPAKRRLSQMRREDLIPPEANEPAFAALAEFAEWCAHPNELGRVPDELAIVHHCELRWPPERKAKPFWLIKYKVRDTTGQGSDDEGCGLVGSVTFCFFSCKLAQRPPEDAYAMHCYWEMEGERLIEESDNLDEAGDYDNLLKQWPGPALENPRLLLVAELSPELQYPQRLVGLASARLKGGQGWVVLDGPRSEWYPCADQPTDTLESLVLKIHVGRHLLGFTGQPDRRTYLAPQDPAQPPG